MADSPGRKLTSEQRDWWTSLPIRFTELGLFIGEAQVMQYWERPLMNRLAEIVSARGGAVLEVGFGLGLSAAEIVRRGVDSYTIIEAHPEVAACARSWAAQTGGSIEIVEGFWQDVLPSLGKFDGILFDTYPLSSDEKSKNHFPFIAAVGEHLEDGGILTYYSDETTEFRPAHLSLLFEWFDEVVLEVVRGLSPPIECDYWKADHMVIPRIGKPRTAGRVE